MTMPLSPFIPSTPHTAVGAGLSGAAVATVLTYTVPAKTISLIKWISVFFTNLAPTVAARITTGGVTVNLLGGTTNFSLSSGIWLQSGDTVTIVVTALVAASTFDAAISAEEYAGQ